MSVPLLFRITLTCPSVRLFKKRDVPESRYGQNISSRSFSRKLGQVDDQGMRDGGSYYRGFMLSQGEGCGEDVRGNGSKHVKGTINHQLLNLHDLGCYVLDEGASEL